MNYKNNTLMTGQQIFDKYIHEGGGYAQVLFTARMITPSDDEFFKSLENAEKQGKKISIVELDEDTIGEHSQIDII